MNQQKSKFQTVWALVLNKHFFQIADSSSLWGPLHDLGSKYAIATTPFKILFWGGVCFIPWVPNFEIGEPYFLVEIFFSSIRPNFFLGKKFKIPPR
jgi:hypothetical protein